MSRKKGEGYEKGLRDYWLFRGLSVRGAPFWNVPVYKLRMDSLRTSGGCCSRGEMGLELCFDFVTDLLDYHVLCANDYRSVFVNENFKDCVTWDFRIFGARVRKEGIGFGVTTEGGVAVNVRPELQKELARCASVIAIRNID